MIRVDVLGGLRVVDSVKAHEELPHQPMRAALLVLLAVERSLPRDRVLLTLWPDRDAERGRRALNQTVYELRRTLGDDCITVSGERIAAGESVRSDVAVFQDAVTNGDALAALQVYRGPFLSGFFLAPTNEFEDWVSRQRLRLGRQVRKLRLELIDGLVQQGRAAQALPHVLRAVEEDPLEDDFQHRLIELLVATGQRTAALRQFDLYSARLTEQGLRPLDHTVELIRNLKQAVAAEPEPVTPATPPAPPASGDTAPLITAETTVAVPTTSPALPVERARLPWRRWLLAAALVLTAGIGALLVWRNDRRDSPPERLAQAEVPQLTVLLFTDASPEPRYGYLARGLTESLVHGLQRRVPRLRVVTLDQGASSAGAGSLNGGVGANLRLDGSVTVADDSVRVRVRLIDGGTGELLRPIEVRRAWRSELALIDSIVPAVIEEMQPVLGQQILKRDLRAGTRSAEAFALYLRALDGYEAVLGTWGSEYDGHSERLLVHVDSLLERADRADPRWARTATLRARVARTRAMYAWDRRQDYEAEEGNALMRAALRYADEAVARDPSDADALTGRAKVRITLAKLGQQSHLERRRALTDGARADLHRAVNADPLTAEAWLLLSDLHYDSAEFDQSYSAALEAWRTDAFLRVEVAILERLAYTTFQLGRDDEAVRWCRLGRTRHPDLPQFLICRSFLFAYLEPVAVDSALAVIEEVESWPRHSGIPMVVELNAARALARAGMADSARAMIRHTRRRGGDAGDPGLHLEAAVFAALGQVDTAIARIREYDRRMPGHHSVLRSRILAPLHDHPAYPRYPASRR